MTTDERPAMLTTLAVVLPIFALILAGCGGSDDGER